MTIKRLLLALCAVSFPLTATAQGLPWSWGRNNQAQLGDGSTTDSNVPVSVAYPTSVVAMAGGYHHSLQLNVRTTVQAWGDNAYGQLGDGTSVDRPTPTFVLDPQGNCCLDDVIAIAAGIMHSMALKSDGSVWTWGNNQFGQLGDGSGVSSQLPVQVRIDNVVAIAAGYLHSVALTADGIVWTWGSNQFGQLGDGTFQNRPVPVPVHYLRGIHVDAIAAGGSHTLARIDGRVMAWGDNAEGQLGDGTTNPPGGRPVPQWVLDPSGKAYLSDVLVIGAGGRHSLAVRRGARHVWAWGSDTYGQLGTGSCNTISVLPVQSGTITEIMQLDGGDAHTIARRIDGVVFTWGHAHYGQLGNGNNGWFMCGPVGIVAGPTQANLPGFGTFVDAGAFHSLAAKQ